MVDPSSLLRAYLNDLVFEDIGDLRHIAKISRCEDDVDAAEAIIDLWYEEKREHMVALFEPLLGERPFRWGKVEIVDEFASVELTNH